MKEEIINLLLVTRHDPCVSILLPLHKTGTDRMQNKLILDRAIRKAKSALKRKTSNSRPLCERLDDLKKKLNPKKTSESIGLFVSPEIAEYVCFPFKVEEKIIVDDTFETRDLHYLKQFMAPYYTLLLTGRFVRLYFSQGAQLDEIHDGTFPMEYADEYEYAKPSFGTSYGFAQKHYEKDKETMNKLRVQSFYRETISHLESYLRNRELPLVVCGPKREVSLFESLNNINDSISVKVYGACVETKLDEAAEKAWMSLRKFRKEQESRLIKEFREKDTRRRLAKGIQEVWEAAMEGRGNHLLVEKDFRFNTYLRDGDSTLYLRPPKGKYVIVPDAVDEIIETVIEKGGKVTFTDQRALHYFDSIALELRY